MQLTIQADLCSVTAAVMEPFDSSKRKGMQVSQLDNRKARNTDCIFSLSSPLPPDWKNCTPYFLELKGKTKEWQERIPSRACLRWWRRQRVSSGAKSLTFDHLQSVSPNDSSPLTRLFCKLKPLSTVLTMHSVTSRLAGRPAAVNWMLLDCVQHHSSCSDLKAYLH